MTYKELKKIAQPHIRKGAELPSNSFFLLNQLHIPFKNEVQCRKDYEGDFYPLYNTPAFLAIRGAEKTIYFNSNTSYWNFYIFHEIAHFLLGHEDDCPQNEMDADMLACILAAPIENLPGTLKSARDLSCTCKIPIDKAEVYWQEIKKEKFFITTFLRRSIVSLLIILCFICIGYTKSHFKVTGNVFNAPNETIFIETNDSKETNDSNDSEDSTENYAENIAEISIAETILPASNDTAPPDRVEVTDTLSITEDIKETTVYITKSGSKYHLLECRYIKNKENLTQLSLEDAKKNGYEACKVCFE